MTIALRSVLVVFALALVSPAAADWRDGMGAFRIGMLAGNDIQVSVAAAEPFRLAVEEGLGVTVEIFAARDYPALIDAAASGRIEYAVFSAAAYAAAFNRCDCLEPLVVARSADGTQGWNAVIITRTGGPADAASLKGRSIAAIDSPAFGALEVTLRQLRAAGADLEAEAALQRFPDGDSAIAALRDGKADALVGWSSLTGDPSTGYSRGTLRRIAEIEGSASQYRIAWESLPVPNRVHAVRKSLPGEARTRLRGILTAMFEADPVAYDAVEPVYGGGFVAARQGQFDALAALIRPPDPEPQPAAAEAEPPPSD